MYTGVYVYVHLYYDAPFYCMETDEILPSNDVLFLTCMIYAHAYLKS